MHGLRPRLTAIFALALLLASPLAQAELFGLTHDRASGAQQLAQIDPASGSLTPIGAGLPACCELGLAATAYDPFAQDLYSVGPDALGALLLRRHALPTGAGTLVGALGSSEHVLGLGFERSTQRLLGLLATDSGALRLVSIDTGTGAATTIHSGLSDCCTLEPGLAAVSGGNFLFIARLRTDTADTRKLYALSTSGSNALAVTTLPADSALVALVPDPNSGLVYGLLQGISVGVHTLQLVQIAPGTGITTVGAATSACCAVAIDNAAIEAGALRVIARDPAAASGFSVLSFTLATGVASFSAASLPLDRIVNGLFDGTKGLTPSLTTITAIAPTPAIIGQPYTVSVSVTAAAGPLAGIVQVSDGVGGSCSITLPASSCQLTSTQIGARTILADYGGGGSIAGSADTEVQTILQAPTTTLISGVVPTPSVVGQAYTVNVSVAGYAPSGTLSVDDGLGGNCSIVLPASSCMLNSLGTGPRTLTASYPGDGNNLPSNGTRAHNVVAAASTTTIVSSIPNPVTVGQPVNVTVSVSGFGIPTGSVLVSDGSGASCTVALPAVSCTLIPASAGNRTLSASYGGDGNNLPSSATQALVVDRAPSTTTITAIAPSPGVAGQPYTVSASAVGYGSLTGTITVVDGTGASCTIALPATACALTSNTAGSKTLTASYSGDSNNLASSDTDLQLVQPAASVTTLVASPNPASVNAPVTLTASIGAGVVPRSGTVAFSADGNPIAGCNAVAVAADLAICNTSFASVGTRALVASYSGDANNLASSAALSLLVDRAPTSTVLTANPNPAAPGAPILLSATVTGGSAGLTGTVSISAGGVPIATCQNLPVNAGLAECTTSFSAPGQIALLASYSGDADDLPSTGALNLGVLLLSIPTLGGSAKALLVLLLGMLGVLALRHQQRV